jgi:hypothetical protein
MNDGLSITRSRDPTKLKCLPRLNEATRITVYAAVKFVGIVKAGVTVRGDQCFLARSGILTAMSPKSRLYVGREVPIVANDRASKQSRTA